MAALGLARAAEAGYQHDVDVPAIARSVLDSLDEDTLTPGDLGVCLWLDQRLGTDRADAILSRISPAVAASGGLKGGAKAWRSRGSRSAPPSPWLSAHV